MRAVSVLSTHPVAAIALGEVVGQVLEALGGVRPGLVLAAVTPPHLGTLEDVGAALRSLLAPDVVLGAVAAAVAGGGRQVEGGPALALFAVTGVAASPLSVEPQPDGGLLRHGGLAGATAAVVLGDVFSCPAGPLAAALGRLPTAGGLVGAARGPGGSRLLLNGAVRTAGAVGAFLGAPARALVSQGGTPVGEPWVVTLASGDIVRELGGRPATERCEEVVAEDEGPVAVGLVLDEHADDPGRADLLIIPVVGPTPGGGLRLARPVPVGRAVRFLRTGPADLETDLVTTLTPTGPRPTGVLLFPGVDRAGDADLASELLGCPVAGIRVSAPLAPVGGAPAVHDRGATGLVLFP